MRTKTSRGLLGLSLPVKIAALVFLAGMMWMSGPNAGPAGAAPPAAAALAAPASSSGPVDAAVAEPLATTPADAPAAPALVVPAEDESHGADPATFFLVLIGILIFAKVFGEAAERVGQPAVLGELLAGLVLGASVLGVVPAAGPIADIIHLLAEVGVAILLFEIGLETDLKEMFQVGKASALVAIIGVALPFAAGFAYWMYADPSIGAHPDGVSHGIVSVFVGATLTATSVGITGPSRKSSSAPR